MSNADFSREAAIAVVAILGARDYYAAIDAPRDASTAELRRCYLKASVLVHPDKNKHPDATKAFQRVAAAWAVLSDEGKRRCYDDELAEGEQGETIQFTPEEAFAAFAFAAAACAAGNGAGGQAGMAGACGDFAESLFWAQQLGQFGNFQQHLHAEQIKGLGFQGAESAMRSASFGGFGPGVSASNPSAGMLVQAASGIALSVGLWSAGLAISFAGLPRIGGTARRIAVFQGLSQVVMASQVPAVREAAGAKLSSLSESVQGAASQVASNHPELSKFARRVRTSGIAAMTELASIVDSSVSSGGSSCFPRQLCLGRRGERHEVDDDSEDWYERNLRLRRAMKRPWKPRAGTYVKLCNLQKAQHLEGCLGEVIGFDRGSARYQIQLLPGRDPSNEDASQPDGVSSALKLVRIENLRSACDRSFKPPASENDFI